MPVSGLTYHPPPITYHLPRQARPPTRYEDEPGWGAGAQCHSERTAPLAAPTSMRRRAATGTIEGPAKESTLRPLSVHRGCAAKGKRLFCTVGKREGGEGGLRWTSAMRSHLIPKGNASTTTTRYSPLRTPYPTLPKTYPEAAASNDLTGQPHLQATV
ncbi:hypothetical protein S40293_10791 [Stachybotrys chartarum IBT 40293]|nr:hypothetical protein S40293_10791 [Stachybotrys chartarum IBT 40293]